MATRKKSARRGARKTTAKRGSGKRDLIAPRGDKRYVRRTARGQFKSEQDNVSRSLSQDVRKKAKRVAKAGHGDEGDERRGTSTRKRKTSARKRRIGAKRKSASKRG